MAVDLTSTDLLLPLLDDTDWRERVVEEFVFGSGEHARVVSTYQLVVATELVTDVYGEAVDAGRVLLPLTTRDKQPLLNFAVDGPAGDDPLLVPRGLTAVLQRTYLEALLETVGFPAPFGPSTNDLLEAICVFTPALFEHFVAEAGDWHAGMARYLTSGLQLANEAVTPATAKEWCVAAKEPGTTLANLLDEPTSLVSSSEQVLLALPRMAEPPNSVEAIDGLVGSYHDGVAQLRDLGAEDFLRLLAEYGRRWQMLLELEVPIGERFKVRVAEDRPFNPQGRRSSRQRFALGDAGSGHLEVRVVDHSVRLRRTITVRDLRGKELAPGLLETERFTPEAASIYSALPERPALVDVDVSLKLRSAVVAPPLIFAVTALLATCTILLLPSGDDLATQVGVLAIPMTVTAAVLVVREQSALATGLQAWPQRMLLAVTCLLWSAVLARLLHEGVDTPPW